MVLLAYYIAAINIEAVYHSIVGGSYQPFEGICLTDTFQMYEKEDLVDALLLDNSARRKRQKKLDIRVIIGNPPYSVGQESANDNNQNIGYPQLDSRIAETYAGRSEKTSVRNIYDSYIRAIRWASDRIGTSGVIGFVTNAGFLDSTSSDGLRKCLADEFSSIYVFHLRGNQRTAGEQSRKEGGKIFGSGSRAPIAISLLVKNPSAKRHGQINFYDIGDYLSREEKLAKITELGSIAGITAANDWQAVVPDAHGDWLRQRDNSFSDYLAMGDKKGNGLKLFENFSLGIATGRDTWCYNASREGVTGNMKRMITFYDMEAQRMDKAFPSLDKKGRELQSEAFINTDATQIAWTRALKQDLAKNKRFSFDETCLTTAVYRPFCKQWLYFNRRLNEMVYQMPRLFPNSTATNLVIMVKQRWSGSGQFALMVDRPCDLQSDGGAQCFPLYLYDEPEPKNLDADSEQFGLFGDKAPLSTATATRRRDAITADGLAHFRSNYPGEKIDREDVFYYVYALMHSSGYRERFADNLGKELPRIPCVNTSSDFWAFSEAGRKLAALHLNYENAQPYPLKIESAGKKLTDIDYRVEKMRYGKKGKEKDLTILHYNEKITLTGIPVEAYEYVVNGKSALDWVVERQGVKMEKDSGIVNDANDWALETMGNPRYPLELFQQVVTVSLETMKIVNALPKLDIASAFG